MSDEPPPLIPLLGDDKQRAERPNPGSSMQIKLSSTVFNSRRGRRPVINRPTFIQRNQDTDLSNVNQHNQNNQKGKCPRTNWGEKLRVLKEAMMNDTMEVRPYLTVQPDLKITSSSTVKKRRGGNSQAYEGKASDLYSYQPLRTLKSRIDELKSRGLSQNGSSEAIGQAPRENITVGVEHTKVSSNENELNICDDLLEIKQEPIIRTLSQNDSEQNNGQIRVRKMPLETEKTNCSTHEKHSVDRSNQLEIRHEPIIRKLAQNEAKDRSSRIRVRKMPLEMGKSNLPIGEKQVDYDEFHDIIREPIIRSLSQATSSITVDHSLLKNVSIRTPTIKTEIIVDDDEYNDPLLEIRNKSIMDRYDQNERIEKNERIPSKSTLEAPNATMAEIQRDEYVDSPKSGEKRKTIHESSVLQRKKKSAEKPCDMNGSNTLCQIRYHIHRHYAGGVIPTMSLLCETLRENGIYHGTLTSIRRKLVKIGFKVRRNDGKDLVVERPDVAICRSKFLREFSCIPWENIIFVDCVRFHSGLTPQDPQLNESTPKQTTLAVFFAAKMSGYLPNTLSLYASKQITKRLSSSRYTKWMNKNMNVFLADPNTRIMMNHNFYKSVRAGASPTMAEKKKDIAAWLVNQGVEFDSRLTKAELQILAENTGAELLSNPTKRFQERLIVLPPFHDYYNPLSRVWPEALKEINDQRLLEYFDPGKMSNAILNHVKNIPGDCWANAVDDIKTTILYDSAFAVALEAAVDLLRLNAENDESSCSSGEEL